MWQPLSPTHVVRVIIRELEDNRQICRGRTRSGAAFVGVLGHLIGQGRIPTTFLWCKASQLTMHLGPTYNGELLTLMFSASKFNVLECDPI